MDINFDKVYYEPDVLNYELGKILRSKYKDLSWVEIESQKIENSPS